MKKLKKISIILTIALVAVFAIKVYALGQEGELCNAHIYCLDGLSCFYYDGGPDGVCVPSIAVGNGYVCMPGGVYMHTCLHWPDYSCDCITHTLENHNEI